MPIKYISTEYALQSSDLCMTVVSAVPSPWGEAAKAILHVKNIAWNAVRFNPMDKTQSDWSGGYPNAPTLVLADRTAINGWREIQAHVDSLESTPDLSGDDQFELCLELSEKFCGPDGLGWHRRLLGIHAGLTGQGGFAPPIAQYLGMKYGYSEGNIGVSVAKSVELITEFVDRLKTQRAAGSPYYLGESLSYVDLYSACFMAMYDPLPEDQCAMHPKSRAVFEQRYPDADHVFDPILLEHRDYIYKTFLELPLSL